MYICIYDHISTFISLSLSMYLLSLCGSDHERRGDQEPRHLHAGCAGEVHLGRWELWLLKIILV